MDVGIRDLKAHLSDYIEQAGRGKIVTVTKRGRAVAKIVAADGVDGLSRLERQGKLVRGCGKATLPSPVEPVGRGRTAADLVREGRR